MIEGFTTEVQHLTKAFERLVGLVLKDQELSTNQSMVLLAIHKHTMTDSPPTMTRVARDVQMNQGNFSTLCKKLEQTGYLVRQRDIADERRVTLTLTKTGDAFCQQFFTQLERLFQPYRDVFVEMYQVIHQLTQTIETVTTQLEGESHANLTKHHENL